MTGPFFVSFFNQLFDDMMLFKAYLINLGMILKGELKLLLCYIVYKEFHRLESGLKLTMELNSKNVELGLKLH